MPPRAQPVRVTVNSFGIHAALKIAQRNPAPPDVMPDDDRLYVRVSRARGRRCALAEHQCQQSAEHDAAEKQRPIRGLQGKKPSFAHNVRKHRKTRC